MISNVRLVVSKLMKGVIRIPATPAMRLPSIQLNALTFPTGTPHKEAAVGLSDTARIDLPKLENCKKAANPTASPSATTKIALVIAPIGAPATYQTQSCGAT